MPTSYYFVGQSVGSANNGGPVSGTTGTFTGSVTSGGQFLGANGTAAAPSFAFTNDPDVGFYRFAANSLGFASAGLTAGNIDASQNWTMVGNVTAPNFVASPATGLFGWTASTSLLATTDGVLRVAKNANGNPTTLVSGMVVGPASATGVAWVYDSTTSGNVGWRAMTGNMGANAGVNAAAFSATGVANVNFGINVGVAGQTGMGHPSTTSIGFYVSNTQYGLVDANGQWSNLRQLRVAKTSNYTVVAADTGTHFTTTGAGGAVQFTLPTAAVGLWFDFTCAAAQTMTVVGAAGTIGVSGNAVRGATLTTLAAAIYTTYRVKCYDGTNWVRCFLDGVAALT